jgi:uncharacterized membrane protein YdfJ with MMPL/SSD domain
MTSVAPPTSGRLARLASAHPRRVLAAAAALFLLAAAFGAPVAGILGSSGKDFQDPVSQYERANAQIEAATHQNAYDNVELLLRGPRAIAGDARQLSAVSNVAALLAAQRGFQRILYYRPSRPLRPSALHPPATPLRSAAQSAAHAMTSLISRDGLQTAVLAAFSSNDTATAAVSRVRAALSRPSARARLAGMSVLYGGYALVNKELNERTTSDLTRAELLGLPFLLLLSFWFFRGLVAALLPPLVGGLAILLTFLGLRFVNHFDPLSVFALNLVSGMGLGLGIDYSLFVLYRYREELAGGADSREAIARTLRTAGRTVLFSSLTVAAAMLSLLVFPLRFLYSMGIGGAIVTLCDGAVALLLLPSLLIVLGPRINALSPSWLKRRAARTARATRSGGWWRVANGVVRRPAPVALIATVVLLIAATPALRVAFISPGANLLPASAEAHQVETRLARDFSSNAGEATEIVLHGSATAAKRLAASAAAAAGPLASAAPPVYLGRATWRISLLPHGSPFSSVQQQLLSKLRALAGPRGALIGGASAYFADQKSAIASHIPLTLLILLPLTAAFLFLMTGSIAVPVKALVMNVLSVSVAVGLQVVIFQEGHLSGLLGFTAPGGLEESSLVLMVVIAFALATDYEVFVLARIKEAHDSGLSNREAIALGVERTGRIVTAAALLFCVAIGALVTSELFFTKQMGLGAALAVAVDATVVRALLVPALMALMGEVNWWAPPALARLHRRVSLGRAPTLAPDAG